LQLRKSGLDYTIVRPGGLVGGGFGADAVKDREAGSDDLVCVGAEGDVQGARDVLRADVAEVIKTVLEAGDAAKGKTVEVVGRKKKDSTSIETLKEKLGKIERDAK